MSVSRLLTAHRGRYGDWVRDVSLAVAEVDRSIYKLEGWDKGQQRVGSGQDAKDGRRIDLERLSHAARHLRDVFSGRGYFNLTDSD